MRSIYPYQLAVVLLLLMSISGMVIGDDGGCPGSSCDSPVYLEPTSMDRIIIEEDNATLWDENTYVNGSLRVVSDLVISGINLTIGGEGIIVEEDASLTIDDSIVDSYSSSFVYYMEIFGTVIIRNSTVVNCLDPLNSYFGIYVDSGSMDLQDADISRSGIIQTDNSTSSIQNSTITGLVSIRSDADIADTTVVSFGISQIGEGIMEVVGSYITSNLTFSIGVSGLSVLNGGKLTAKDVTVTGSYNAGVFSSHSSLDLSDSSIQLDEGLYGVKLDNTTMDPLRNITIDGGLGGISLYGCDGEVSIVNVTTRCTDFGLISDGPQPAAVEGSEFHGSIIGIEAKSPLTMGDTLMSDNKIGLRMNDDFHLTMTGCEIIDYGHWGIEEQTWGMGTYPDNIYTPAQGAKGQIAWWGPVTISVKGPGDIPVKGAMLAIDSEIETTTLQDPGELNFIWGYSTGVDIVENVQYDMEISWKDTTSDISFTPSKGLDLEIYLPLTDVWISSVDFRDGKAHIRIVSNGTGADNVHLSLYADGSWRGEATITLESDAVEVVKIPLELDDGDHKLMARATSVDEYKGSGGMLQDNNELESSVNVADKADTGTSLIWFAVTGIILLLLIPFLIRDRTKS